MFNIYYINILDYVKKYLKNCMCGVAFARVILLGTEMYFGKTFPEGTKIYPCRVVQRNEGIKSS